MKPARFDLLTPSSIDEVLSLLSKHGPEARLLAGGQSLVPMMNFRLARPSILIDLNQVPDLDYINDSGNSLVIGAMTRERTIENNALIEARAPLLHEATKLIGHLPIRTRGTIGGSLANADPAAEYPAVALALDCQIVAQSVRGQRVIDAADFITAPLTTTLAEDELLTEIIVPKASETSGSAFIELARRHGDFALAGVAARLSLSEDRISEVGLAACGAGPGPVRLRNAEAILAGCNPDEVSLDAVADLAAEDVDPETDIHASAQYRRKLTGVLAKRAVAKAIVRARGKP